MVFVTFKAESDIWMRKSNNIYKYISVYVDDLDVAGINPKQIIDELQGKHKLKLNGLGSLTFHLGRAFFCDLDNTLCVGHKIYIDKFIS